MKQVSIFSAIILLLLTGRGCQKTVHVQPKGGAVEKEIFNTVYM